MSSFLALSLCFNKVFATESINEDVLYSHYYPTEVSREEIVRDISEQLELKYGSSFSELISFDGTSKLISASDSTTTVLGSKRVSKTYIPAQDKVWSKTGGNIIYSPNGGGSFSIGISYMGFSASVRLDYGEVGVFAYTFPYPANTWCKLRITKYIKMTVYEVVWKDVYGNLHTDTTQTTHPDGFIGEVIAV